MLVVWRAEVAELLMQIHDAILIQYHEEAEDEVLPQVMSKLTQHVPLKHDRTLSLVPDIKVGWNWGNWSAENPDGLKSYVPGDKRNRSPKTSILDRIIP
jgi:hypothetical protein